MKKYLSVLFCCCLLFSLAAPALASESEPDYIAEYEAEYGPAPSALDFPDPADYQAAYDVWWAGLEPYVIRRAAEYERQKKAAEDKAADEKAVEAPSTPSKTVESEGSTHVNQPRDSYYTGSDYPVGSYVSPAGNVYGPDGTLLSPGTTPAMEPDDAPAPGRLSDDALLSEELGSSDDVSSYADPDTLAVIADLVSDIASDPSVFTIEDLRPSDPPAEVLTGLKALVTSIFGEYTPVTTTSVVTQTVGNDTVQYLVETVAPGAAGVDYEWVAGVFLFGILLFCFMKLLGGVLK